MATTHLIGEGSGPCLRAIKQNGDNQSAIHVDLGSYADAVFVKSEFDRRHMAEEAWAMRDVDPTGNVTRGRAVIRDQGFNTCDGIYKLCFLVAYLQRQMVGSVRGRPNSHKFGLRSADFHPPLPTRLGSSCSIIRPS